MEKEDFDLFSRKMRFINLFLVLTIATGHIACHAGGDDSLTSIYKMSTGGAMGWFFFSAAFWFFKKYNNTGFIRAYLSKMKTLLLPYLLFNGIALVIKGKEVFGDSSFVSKNGLKVLIKSMVFLYGFGYENLPVDNPTWYIIRLLSYFLIAPVIWFLLRNRLAGIVSLFFIFFFTMNGSYYYFKAFLFIFCLGAYVSLHLQEEFIRTLTSYTVRIKFPISLVLFICIYAFLSWLTIKIIDPFSGFNMGMLTIQQVLISGISVAFFNPPDSLKPRWGGVELPHILLPYHMGYSR